MSELPFMATENIMMDAVKAGGDRQQLHEQIRILSMEAGRNVKEEGKENNLLDLIAEDEMFPFTREELEIAMDASKYVGRSKEQVEQAKEYHEGLKSGKYRREHTYAMAYANKAVKEAKKNYDLAVKLWGDV